MWEAEEAFSECVKSRWSAEWMCIVDRVWPYQGPQCLRPLGMAKRFPQVRLRGNCSGFEHWQCAQVHMFMNNWPVCVKPSNCSFLLLDVRSLRPLAYRDLLPRLLTLPPVLCIINMLRFRAAAQLLLLQQRVHVPPDPGHLGCAFVCLFFLHSPSAPSRFPGQSSVRRCSPTLLIFYYIISLKTFFLKKALRGKAKL